MPSTGDFHLVDPGSPGLPAGIPKRQTPGVNRWPLVIPVNRSSTRVSAANPDTEPATPLTVHDSAVSPPSRPIRSWHEFPMSFRIRLLCRGANRGQPRSTVTNHSSRSAVGRRWLSNDQIRNSGKEISGFDTRPRKGGHDLDLADPVGVSHLSNLLFQNTPQRSGSSPLSAVTARLPTSPVAHQPGPAARRPGRPTDATVRRHHQHPIIGAHAQLNQRGGDCGHLIAQSRVTDHKITVAK